jgi:hypothetical protein
MSNRARIILPPPLEIAAIMRACRRKVNGRWLRKHALRSHATGESERRLQVKNAFLVCAVAAASIAALPSAAVATTNNNESARYQLHIEVPNVAESADGDTVSITGEGEFGFHPKMFTGEGNFTLTNDGTPLSGTWTGIKLLSFQPYGCGVVFGNVTLPPNFCGGFINARVLLTPTTGPTLTGILRVVCIIGDVPGQYFVSKNATEGITLNVPGVENYNHQVSGMNVFIRSA